MYTKARIYNLALGALLLQRRIIETDTDLSNEAKVLNDLWDTAFRSTLEDLDLDSTSTTATLELIEADPNERWLYAYKYPTDCAFLRRIETAMMTDNRTTRIPLRVGMHGTRKAIFTNEADATVEYISYDIPLNHLSANVGLAIAYKLAILAAPLITGKGARELRKDIEARYLIAKTEAQEQDRRENFNYIDADIGSEFVEARTE